MEDFVQGPWPGMIVAALSVPLFWGAFRSLKRKRMIENMPTSKCVGIALGLAELKGVCEPLEALLRSPLEGRECVHFGFWVQEYQMHTYTTTDSKGNTTVHTYYIWVTLETGSAAVPFTLRDDSGSVAVVPDRATVEAPVRFSVELDGGHPLYEWSYEREAGQHARRRFTERRIESGDALYVMGTANLDRETGLPYLSWDKDDKFFVISTRTEEQVRRSYGWAGCGTLFCALLILGGGVFWALFRLGMPIAGAGIAAGLLALLSVALMWTLFLHNDLVWVREQMRKAMGNLDADLKRRWDLIPNLVAVVKGYAAHESSTLEGVIQGRVAADVPTEINDQTRTLARLYAVVERYPDLKADAVFLDLVRRLTAIENRIALVRTFYNDAVTAYNTRIRFFPDVILAKLGRFELQPLLRIEAFEPRPVEVKFDRPGVVARARQAGRMTDAAAGPGSPGTEPWDAQPGDARRAENGPPGPSSGRRTRRP